MRKLTVAQQVKTAAVSTAGAISVGSGTGGSQALFCELCNVSCSGYEVMKTHINGARHKKVSDVYNFYVCLFVSCSISLTHSVFACENVEQVCIHVFNRA